MRERPKPRLDWFTFLSAYADVQRRFEKRMAEFRAAALPDHWKLRARHG